MNMSPSPFHYAVQLFAFTALPPILPEHCISVCMSSHLLIACCVHQRHILIRNWSEQKYFFNKLNLRILCIHKHPIHPFFISSLNCIFIKCKPCILSQNTGNKSQTTSTPLKSNETSPKPRASPRIPAIGEYNSFSKHVCLAYTVKPF